MDPVIVIIISCIVRGTILFLQAEKHSAAEIQGRLCRKFGDNVMSYSSVRDWSGNSGIGAQMFKTRKDKDNI